MIRRTARWFCALGLGLALVSGCTSPLSPSAPRVYRIGWLQGGAQGAAGLQTDTLRQALSDMGYVEGKNLVVEIRYADGDASRDRALAAELVALKPDLILVRSVPEALALKQATTTIPVVLAGTPDPVENGLVTNLARPGGNITGAANAGTDIASKLLQLLKEAFPSASRIAYLFDPSNPANMRGYEQARTAAGPLGITLQPMEARSGADVADALVAIDRAKPDAISVAGGPLLLSQRPLILEFIAKHRLPSITVTDRTWVDGGALMFYADNTVETLRATATYVDKILKGANPADIPIQKPSKFDLIINLKTAQALGLTIPPSVLAQATELIQ